MKTTRNLFLLVAAMAAIFFATTLLAQDTQPAAPPVSPQSFQNAVLAWIGVATVIVTALAGFVAHVLAKLSEIKQRQDRQSEKTGQLTNQVVDLAKAVPPTTKAMLALFFPALLFSGCASLSPEDRAGWNRIGQQAAGAAVGFGLNYARNYATQHDRDMEGYRK